MGAAQPVSWKGGLRLNLEQGLVQPSGVPDESAGRSRKCRLPLSSMT